MQIPEATKLPIRAEHPGDFSTTFIYSLPNVPGLYRRITRDGRSGFKVGEGNTLAVIPVTKFDDTEVVHGFCELARWTEGEQLLRPLLPGMESPISDDPDNPME